MNRRIKKKLSKRCNCLTYAEYRNSNIILVDNNGNVIKAMWHIDIGRKNDKIAYTATFLTKEKRFNYSTTNEDEFKRVIKDWQEHIQR